MGKKHILSIARVSRSQQASRQHDKSTQQVYSQVLHGVPRSSRLFPYGDKMAEQLQSHPPSNSSPVEKSKIIFSTKLVTCTLIRQTRSSAHPWTRSSGQGQGLLWWPRPGSCETDFPPELMAWEGRGSHKQILGNGEWILINQPARVCVFYPI